MLFYTLDKFVEQLKKLNLRYSVVHFNVSIKIFLLLFPVYFFIGFFVDAIFFIVIFYLQTLAMHC